MPTTYRINLGLFRGSLGQGCCTYAQPKILVRLSLRRMYNVQPKILVRLSLRRIFGPSGETFMWTIPQVSG